jgi:hypothetical protein
MLQILQVTGKSDISESALKRLLPDIRGMLQLVADIIIAALLIVNVNINYETGGSGAFYG